MLNEQYLTHLESVCRTVESGGRLCSVRITPDELRQLIAAARVANAAARVERERLDGNRPDRWREGVLYPGHSLRIAADWQLDRAIARYTQPQPQQVSQ